MLLRGRSALHPGDGATRMFTAANEEFQFTANDLMNASLDGE